MLHISIAAEPLWTVWGLPITNSLLATWLTMAVLAFFAFISTKKMSLIPGHAQSIAELIVGGLYDFFSAITGRHAKKFFPLVASIFLFVIIANWIGLLPGVGTIGLKHEESAVHEQAAGTEAFEAAPKTESVPSHGETTPTIAAHDTPKSEVAAPPHETEKTTTGEHAPALTPILRAATADLNMTLALAVVAVLAIQYFGFSLTGFHYSSRFINFSDPIMFFLGILELMSEVSKVISFAFRLFGNIFAGEVLLAVLAFLMPFVIPLPFLMMELFVGFIQALVFSMLTAVFLNVAVSHGEEHHAK